MHVGASIKTAAALQSLQDAVNCYRNKSFLLSVGYKLIDKSTYVHGVMKKKIKNYKTNIWKRYGYQDNHVDCLIFFPHQEFSNEAHKLVKFYKSSSKFFSSYIFHSWTFLPKYLFTNQFFYTLLFSAFILILLLYIYELIDPLLYGLLYNTYITDC